MKNPKASAKKVQSVFVALVLIFAINFGINTLFQSDVKAIETEATQQTLDQGRSGNTAIAPTNIPRPS